MPDSWVLNFLLCSISILVLTLCRSKQMLFSLQHSGPAICPSNREGKKNKSRFVVSTADGAQGVVVICQALILVQHILLPPVTLQIDIIRRPKLCYCLNMTTPQRERWESRQKNSESFLFPLLTVRLFKLLSIEFTWSCICTYSCTCHILRTRIQILAVLGLTLAFSVKVKNGLMLGLGLGRGIELW